MGLNSDLIVLSVYAKTKVLSEEFALVEWSFEKRNQAGEGPGFD